MSPSALEGLPDGLRAIHPSRLTALGNERYRRRPKRHIAFDASGWRPHRNRLQAAFRQLRHEPGRLERCHRGRGRPAGSHGEHLSAVGSVPGRARMELRLRRRGLGRHGRPRRPGKGRPQAARRAGKDVLPARRTAGPEHRRGPAPATDGPPPCSDGSESITSIATFARWCGGAGDGAAAHGFKIIPWRLPGSPWLDPKVAVQPRGVGTAGVRVYVGGGL